ncbi:dihydropteroate synthase [Clostridium cylindrosporum]|uniref:Dihydropteroate synthase n=1 Tax=Clostridium cylindrosporum DSM 605 TaxID=1121307 RepID=A0A0J8D9C6_CLOCY|nr:dihydropteroate synthase [Clostridium cylindrosporum]KMT20893.1 dihydropteroate synthase FolP [Clostridium cylindrosporum DSM 605]
MRKNITLKDGKVYNFDNMKIMGILNATHNSFYEESRVSSLSSAVEKAKEMIANGADILDIGGESTKPGSDPVDVDEEIQRVVPLIKEIRKVNKDVLISVDTYRAKTAEEAIKAGADIINDISGLTFDDRMADVVRDYDVPVIIMHIKGTPKDMQQNPQYDDVVKEMKEFFRDRIDYAISKGIKEDKIMLDPGIGFGKLYEHNIEAMKKIEEFYEFDMPILLAVSRKTTIGVALGNLPPEERLEGTMAITCYAALKGIEMIRVHDVLENYRAARMAEVLRNE